MYNDERWSGGNEKKIRKRQKKIRVRGGAPPRHPPVKAHKVSKCLLSASQRPYIAGASLDVGADVAVAEVHVPCVGRAVHVGGRRPVVVRLHARKRITLGPVSRSSGIRQCWIKIFRIY